MSYEMIALLSRSKSMNSARSRFLSRSWPRLVSPLSLPAYLAWNAHGAQRIGLRPLLLSRLTRSSRCLINMDLWSRTRLLYGSVILPVGEQEKQRRRFVVCESWCNFKLWKMETFEWQRCRGVFTQWTIFSSGPKSSAETGFFPESNSKRTTPKL